MHLKVFVFISRKIHHAKSVLKQLFERKYHILEIILFHHLDIFQTTINNLFIRKARKPIYRHKKKKLSDRLGSGIERG